MEAISFPPSDLDDPAFQFITQALGVHPMQLQQAVDYLRQNQRSNQEVPALLGAAMSRTPNYGIGSGSVVPNLHRNCCPRSIAAAIEIYEMFRNQNYGSHVGTSHIGIGSGSVAPNIPYCDCCQPSTATVTASDIHEMCQNQNYGFHHSDSLDRTDDILRGLTNNYHCPTFRGILHNCVNRDLIHNRCRRPGQRPNWRPGPYIGRRAEPQPNLMDNFQPTLTGGNQINFRPVHPSQDYQQHPNIPAGLEWMAVSREDILFFKKMEKYFMTITSNSRNDQELPHSGDENLLRPDAHILFAAPSEQNRENLQDINNTWQNQMMNIMPDIASNGQNNQRPTYTEDDQTEDHDEQESPRPTDQISFEAPSEQNRENLQDINNAWQNQMMNIMPDIASNGQNYQGPTYTEEDQTEDHDEQESPRPTDQISFEAPSEQNTESLQDGYNIWHYPLNHNLQEAPPNLNDQGPSYSEVDPIDRDSASSPDDHISISSEEESE